MRARTLASARQDLRWSARHTAIDNPTAALPLSFPINRAHWTAA
jgi:hypothetical protein